MLKCWCKQSLYLFQSKQIFCALNNCIRAAEYCTFSIHITTHLSHCTFTAMTRILMLLLLIVAASLVVESTIECHSCGIRKKCSLPYDPTKAAWITCPVSCMKFDGQRWGQRINYRGCGNIFGDKIDANVCNETAEWFGAKGKTTHLDIEMLFLIGLP